MNIIIEKEYSLKFDFDIDEIISSVIEASLDYVNCPYESEISVTLTDNENIHKINKEHRGIDASTDVLSFPMVEYDKPGDFTILENDDSCFNPETGELMLGDIIISLDKVISQAEEFNHSPKRELAFLIAHSMLHLSGYDHLEDEERKVMENKQREILVNLGLTRDC